VLDVLEFQERLIICANIMQLQDDGPNWMQFAAWDGEDWHTMGGVFGGLEARKVAIFQDKLYAVGRFFNATNDNTIENSFPVSNVVYYDGQEWHSPLYGVNGDLYDLLVDEENDLLYVAGYCTDASGVTVRNVAAWDGQNWHQVGTNLTGDVYAIEMYRGQLYVGGIHILSQFGTMAYFDGVEWQPVPGDPFNIGSNSAVKELTAYGDHLYASGNFNYINANDPAQGLAKYYLHPDSVQWAVPDNVRQNKKLNFSFYPNPANDFIYFETDIKEKFSIHIADLSGRTVLQTSFDLGNQFQIDIRSLVSGIYCIKLISDNGAQMIGKVMVE
jgi:Secretion system C-terminal sorting domain